MDKLELVVKVNNGNITVVKQEIKPVPKKYPKEPPPPHLKFLPKI